MGSLQVIALCLLIACTRVASRQLLDHGETAPPEGTLVGVWDLVPAKNDGGQFWTTPISNYAWFSTYPDYAKKAILVYYLKRAYVAGPHRTEIDLKLEGACDLTTRTYPSTQAIYDSCKGTATFSADVSITGYWAVLESAGQTISIPKPFKAIEISTGLFGGGQPATATYLGQELDGRSAPSLLSPGGPSVGGTVGIIGSARIGPYDQKQQGDLSFRTITLKVAYTGASAKKGDKLSWLIPYTAAFVEGINGPPAITNTPAGYTLVPASVACPSVNGVPTNSCFNSVGTHHVCCINPDSCGAFTPSGGATCTNNKYYVFTTKN